MRSVDGEVVVVVVIPSFYVVGAEPREARQGHGRNVLVQGVLVEGGRCKARLAGGNQLETAVKLSPRDLSRAVADFGDS